MAKQIGNTDLIDTWASEGSIVDPDLSKKEEGWLLGEQPPHEWMNYIQNEHGQKINRLLDDTYSNGLSLRQELDGDVANGQGARLVRGAVIYVDTVADLQALDTSGLVEGQQASVGEAGMFVWSGSEWLPKNSETITVRIPSDYPTLQEAIDTLSNFVVPSTGSVSILIESGHKLSSPLSLSGGNYSKYRIESEDSVVGVENGALKRTDFRQSIYPVFEALNGCVFPYIDILIDLQDYEPSSGDSLGSGYLCAEGSLMNIAPERGCIGGGLGVVAYDGSTVNCRGGDFKHSKYAGISAWTNSTVHAVDADASFSETYGVVSTEGSSVLFKRGKATDCARHATRAVASAFLDVTSADVRRSATKGVYARHSCVVMANFVDARDCVEDGIRSQRGCMVTAIECKVDGCATGLNATDSSTIVAPSSSAKNCGVSIFASGLSCVAASSTDCNGSDVVAEIANGSSANITGLTASGGQQGIRILNNSHASCGSSAITGFSGSALRVSEASSADAGGSDFSGAGQAAVSVNGASRLRAPDTDCSGSETGFLCQRGSSIDANNSIADGCTNGIYALYGGSISFRGGSAKNCTRGLWAQGGIVDAQDADFTGASQNGVRAERCAHVTLRDALCRKGGQDDSEDIRASGTSIIQASNAQGGTNTPTNELSSLGMILR